MLKYINVGCGKLQEKSTDEIEWINVDQFAEVKPDLVHDMTKRFPFEDSSIDQIRAIACLGQIETNADFLATMNEFWRLIRPSGQLFVYIPHKNWEMCWHDPFNTRKTNEAYWLGFDEKDGQYIQHNSYYGFKPWKNVSAETNNSGFISAWLTPSK